MTGAKQKTPIRVVRFSIDHSALTPAQVVAFARHAGAARQTWNWALGRWMDWRNNTKFYVDYKVFKAAGMGPGLSTDDLIQVIERAVSIRQDDKWMDAAWDEARQIHGEWDQFQKASTLQSLYLAGAQEPFDPSRDDGINPYHWWVTEGDKSGLPKAERHNVNSGATYTAPLRAFEEAVGRFYKLPGKKGTPKFKSKHDDEQGFCIQRLTETGLSPWRAIEGGHRIKVPSIGSIRVVQSTKRLRQLIKRGGKTTSARFTRRGGKWFVSVSVAFDLSAPRVQRPARLSRRQRAGGSTGVDLGVNRLATLSSGDQFPNRRLLRKSMAEIKRLQRKFDRQHRAGSPECFNEDGTHKKRCRWGREDGPAMSRSAQTTKRQLRRIHDLTARRRAGVLHEITKDLATRFELIGVEDLNVAGMTAKSKPKPDPDRPGHFLPNRRAAKAGLNRAILDVGFYEFKRQLGYKTEWYGSTMQMVHRYAATSKTCSGCGWVKPKLTLAERTFNCTQCGLAMDRDHNAAVNIRALALEGAAPMEREQPAPVGAAEKRHRDPVSHRRRPKSLAPCESTRPVRDLSPPATQEETA
ncbi:RNA-guided endonuclease TnpB family protein [Pseudactinotalea sp. HY160]|uniref:RNA-guided endonuclease InsQ/TnpB family protein n=1 Tax=Pseudactinotalea sp. HY160 TaxID=2654490 RepID=UPI00188412AC|nr:RNA-guided endonuclease TnpB family protein [Pseudactinotalea sp. HY160]